MTATGLALTNSLKQECVHGHPLIGRNVIEVTRDDRGGVTHRHCRACQNRRALERYYARKVTTDGT